DNYGDEFDPDEHSEAIREAFERLRQVPGWAEHLAAEQRDRAVRFWHDERYAEVRARLLAQRQNMRDETRQAMREAQVRRYGDPAERNKQAAAVRKSWAKDAGSRRRHQAEIARAIKLRPEIPAEVVRAGLDRTGSIRGAARLLQCDRSVFRRFPEVLRAFHGRRRSEGPDNHKVAALRDVP